MAYFAGLYGRNRVPQTPDDHDETFSLADGDISDAEELKDCSGALAFTDEYVQDWTEKDGFRELFQNR
jgi:hypothetical protein